MPHSHGILCLPNQLRSLAGAAEADPKADKLGMVRVVDESGEDYLYPKDQFGKIELAVRIALAGDFTTFAKPRDIVPEA